MRRPETSATIRVQLSASSSFASTARCCPMAAKCEKAKRHDAMFWTFGIKLLFLHKIGFGSAIQASLVALALALFLHYINENQHLKQI